MKHKSICDRLDGSWLEPWDSLTDEQQDAWREAAFTNAVPKVTTRTINEAGVVRVENVVAPTMERTPWIAWDWLTPEQRESHARQRDLSRGLGDAIAQSEGGRAFDLVFQLDDAEKRATRLREAAEWSTGQDHSEDIRNAEKAEAEAARIRAELDRMEQQGTSERAESTTEHSTPEPWIVKAREYAADIWLRELSANKRPSKEAIAKEVAGRLYRDDKMVTKTNKRITADYVIRYALSPTSNGGWKPPEPE